MSRIGKQPIKIPENVEVKIEGDLITVKGPKGELRNRVPLEIKIEIKDKELKLKPTTSRKETQALWGTWRSLINNMIQGVTQGFEKKLEIRGVGYRAELKDSPTGKAGKNLVLSLGYSHLVKVRAPQDIKFKIEKNTITVSGIDRQVVGQIAADIRRKRKPEPYKGKGIRYKGEIVRRKAGKKAAAME